MKVRIHKASKPIVRQSPTLLVTGDGRSLIADLRIVRGWNITHDTACIGRSIKLVERADHFVDIDASSSIWWAKNLPADKGSPLRHTCGEVEGFDVDWDYEQPDYHYKDITGELRTHGSTALFAALCALEMGYERVILAGCPMDTEGHWYFDQSRETLGPVWLGIDFMAWLDFAKQEEAARVRSLSGYTAQILGKADETWTAA